jgi:hypothetical protein
MPAPIVLLCCVAGVQLFGLMTVALARISEGSRAESPTRALFFLALTCVAGTLLLAIGLHDNWWPLCALTFGVMIVGATIDARGNRDILAE